MRVNARLAARHRCPESRPDHSFSEGDEGAAQTELHFPIAATELRTCCWIATGPRDFAPVARAAARRSEITGRLKIIRPYYAPEFSGYRRGMRLGCLFSALKTGKLSWIRCECDLQIRRRTRGAFNLTLGAIAALGIIGNLLLDANRIFMQ
jgi:hypothetical protein